MIARALLPVRSEWSRPVADAASDLIKRVADPVLELLLNGYDPSAEDSARTAAAGNDDKGSAWSSSPRAGSRSGK